MVPARRDQGQALADAVAVGGLPDFNLAETVEALGKGGGELLRHVLDDGNARCSRRQGGQYGFQGLGTARGSPNGDEIGRASCRERVEVGVGGVGGKEGLW